MFILKETDKCNYLVNKYRVVDNNTPDGRSKLGSVISLPTLDRVNSFIILAGSALGLTAFFVRSSISYLCNKPCRSLLDE